MASRDVSEMPLRTWIGQEDLRRLDDGQCLNDNLIAFGLQHLLVSSKHDHPHKRIYLHNSYFHTNLKGSGYESVKSWTSNVDLLSYDYIVVPVNEGFHWWVAIICNPGMLDSATPKGQGGKRTEPTRALNGVD